MRYRKKPVVIEAFEMTRDRRRGNIDWPQWLHAAWNDGTLRPSGDGPSLSDRLIIKTLEGDQLVSWGDFIIQGVKGELYPCKPDIFALTYEPVDLLKDYVEPLSPERAKASE